MEFLIAYIAYGVVTVLAYIFLARYRNRNTNTVWHDNSVDAWGALFFSIFWPIVLIVELVTFIIRNAAPVIDGAVHSLHRRVSK